MKLAWYKQVESLCCNNYETGKSHFPFFCTLDINECEAENGGCNQTCMNTVGSFLCSCASEYVLDEDGFTCKGKHIHCKAIQLCTVILLLFFYS